MISGNRNYSVDITDGSHDNVVEGNEIGTDRDGTAALPNNDGIALGIPYFEVDNPSAFGNTIGGTTTGVGNVISGNIAYGVDMSNIGATGNLVAGNRIGTTADGTTALPNGGGLVIGATPTRWAGRWLARAI